MLAIIGLVFTMAMVFGGYALAGGIFSIIIKALPFEMMMIGGASVGSFMLGNKGKVVKKSVGDLGKIMGNGKWNAQDYQDLLCM